ncbi:MAG: TraR/DksA C4-type zinc finger protein [Myxococcaceae bacterium]|nr:TraR/DksA C4-type zinc finger protein [Myxococcaceae bacterium]MBH2006007.1 TraR/DksA C4-type zinc finger protein [Myxococcaceae bacterium]
MAITKSAEKSLTEAQQQELIGILEDTRTELQEKLKKRRNGTTSEQVPGDEADLASEDAEISLETRLMDRDAKLLREVERALEKVQNGSYGLCEGTDEPIGYARLKLRPWTRYSVTYKEELEREEKRLGTGE